MNRQIYNVPNNDQEKKIAGHGPLPQEEATADGQLPQGKADEERMIMVCAVGKRYGIQTIARRTGVLPASVSQILNKNKVYFDLALKEWRVRK